MKDKGFNGITCFVFYRKYIYKQAKRSKKQFRPSIKNYRKRFKKLPLSESVLINSFNTIMNTKSLRNTKGLAPLVFRRDFLTAS